MIDCDSNQAPSRGEDWTVPNGEPVYTVYYQGMMSSQTQLAKYVGRKGFVSTTGEHVTIGDKGIEVILRPWIGKELDEVIPSSVAKLEHLEPQDDSSQQSWMGKLINKSAQWVARRRNCSVGIEVAPTRAAPDDRKRAAFRVVCETVSEAKVIAGEAELREKFRAARLASMERAAISKEERGVTANGNGGNNGCSGEDTATKDLPPCSPSKQKRGKARDEMLDALQKEEMDILQKFTAALAFSRNNGADCQKDIPTSILLPSSSSSALASSFSLLPQLSRSLSSFAATDALVIDRYADPINVPVLGTSIESHSIRYWMVNIAQRRDINEHRLKMLLLASAVGSEFQSKQQVSQLLSSNVDAKKEDEDEDGEEEEGTAAAAGTSTAAAGTSTATTIATTTTTTIAATAPMEASDGGRSSNTSVLTGGTHTPLVVSYPSTILWGVSRGAATTFSAFCSHYYTNVKLVVLEAPFYSIPSLLETRYSRAVARIALAALQRVTSFNKNGPSPASLVHKCPPHVPFAFISSRADTEVPLSETRRFIDALMARGQNPIWLLVLDHSAHPSYPIENTQDRIQYACFMHALYRHLRLPYIARLAELGQSLLVSCQLFSTPRASAA